MPPRSAKRPSTMTGAPFTPADRLSILIGDLDLSGIFERIELAENEIAEARRRWPHASDRLYHSFELLTPTHERMDNVHVYRAHCRELLDRVATGADTRPATAAEVCCALFHVSQMVPMTSAATGLYMRMWRAAGLPDFPELIKASEHHEALESSRIDDHEQATRHKLAVPTRKLDRIDCHGCHHGERVTCTYSTAYGNGVVSEDAKTQP